MKVSGSASPLQRMFATSTEISLLTLALLLAAALPVAAQDWVPYLDVKPSAHVVSPEVRSMPEAAGRVAEVVQVPIRHRPSFVPHGHPNNEDPALQKTAGSSVSASTVSNFNGVSYNGYYPPDPSLSVGTNQIVQTTNVQFAVYAKNGTLLKGPVALNTLFGGLGNLCSTTNGGDPIVLWDKIKGRWLVSQLAYNNNFTENYVCVAVSQTGDALGAFNVYSFGFAHLPDYPKFGVWSSSSVAGGSDYYLSANMFSTALYYGPMVCAFNGGDMQTGQATARFACVQGSTSHFSLLPSDEDGSTPPATGEPNYFVELGSGSSSTGNTLLMFPFVATWSPGAGSLNSPTATTLAVQPYSLACSGGGACIPQAGTSRQLDSLGDRLMYRLAFRKFSSHESLLANHSVDEGNGIVGIRWYEITSTSGTLATSASIAQQGTYSGLDGNYRWMGSIAQDQDGNIALGYSTSSSQLFPSISFTGRSPGDPAGTLGQETDIVVGTGAETSASRWGDYASMSIDPADDCTFWYTGEYFASSGLSWRTRIAAFQFQTCGAGKTATSTTLTSSLNPSAYGQPVTFTATVTPTSGGGTPGGTVTFLDNGVTFGSASLDATGKAMLSTSSLPGGTDSITASYGGDSTFDTSSSDPLSQVVNRAGSTTTLTSGPNPSVSGQTVTFTATVTTGATGLVQFLDTSTSTSLGTASLDTNGHAQVSTSSLSVGDHVVTATYQGDQNFSGSTTSTGITQTVDAAPAGTFSLSSPTAPQTASRNSSATFEIDVTPSNGFTGDVALSATNLPPQSTPTFTPGTVTVSGGSTVKSTLKISIGSHTPKKTYTVTITGTSGSLVETTTVTVTVR